MAASKSRARGGKELVARRRAALERAAVRVAAEREAAARAEEERLAREAEFDELAADFELAREDEEQVAAEVEAELRLVRERGQVRIQQVRLVAARVVVAMGGRGETVAGCARRLGVGADRVKELRRLGREEGAAVRTGTRWSRTRCVGRAVARRRAGAARRRGRRGSGTRSRGRDLR